MIASNSPVELALQAAVRADPGDNLPRLVYADWLDEQGRDEQAQFLRVFSSVPVVLIDGDTDAERSELSRVLSLRKQLRDRRRGLDRAWLKTIGDPGLVGEILVDTQYHFTLFGVVIRETTATVLVAKLGRRKLPPRDGAYGPERPLLPTGKEFARIVSNRRGCEVSNRRRMLQQFKKSLLVQVLGGRHEVLLARLNGVPLIELITVVHLGGAGLGDLPSAASKLLP